jgi:hypothetical protein
MFFYAGSTTIAALLCQRSVVAVERDTKQFQEICKRVVSLGNILNDPTQLAFNDDKSFPSPSEPMGDRYNFKVQVGDHSIAHRGFALHDFRKMNGYVGADVEEIEDDDDETQRMVETSPDLRPAPASSSSSSGAFFKPLKKGEEQFLFDYHGPPETWTPLVFAQMDADWDTLFGDETHGCFPNKSDDEESYENASLQDFKMEDEDFDSIGVDEPVRFFYVINCFLYTHNYIYIAG